MISPVTGSIISVISVTALPLGHARTRSTVYPTVPSQTNRSHLGFLFAFRRRDRERVEGPQCRDRGIPDRAKRWRYAAKARHGEPGTSYDRPAERQTRRANTAPPKAASRHSAGRSNIARSMAHKGVDHLVAGVGTATRPPVELPPRLRAEPRLRKRLRERDPSAPPPQS